MDFIDQEILAGELVPVLLGISPKTWQISHRLYRRYNVISHVFCNKLPFPLRLSLCMKYHVIGHTADERLMLHALQDFAAQLEKADVIPYLVPCTEPFENLAWEHHELLERRFVIADQKGIAHTCFDREIPQQKGGRAYETR